MILYNEKIIVTASGGGHTGYAVALAQRLHGRADTLFIIPRNDKWTKSKVKYHSFSRVLVVTPIESPTIRCAEKRLHQYFET